MDTPDDVPSTDRGVSTRRGVLGLAGLVGGGALLQPVAGRLLGRPPSPDGASDDAAASSLPLGTGDWPQHSADAGNTAHLPDGVAPTGNVSEAWRYDNDRYHDGLAVVDGTVYVGGKSLAAVDAATGTERWTYRPEVPPMPPNSEADTPEFGTPAVGDGQVYASVGFGVYDGGVPGRMIVAVDAATGEERWRYERTDQDRRLSTPTVYDVTDVGETIYTHGGPEVHALAPDGSVRWTKTVPDGDDRTTPLPVADGRVYVRQEAGVVALDAATGEVAWESLQDEDVGISQLAIVAGGTLYVGVEDGSTQVLVALDAATGEERWRTTGEDGVMGVSIRAASSDSVYVRTDDADAMRFDAADGSERWRTSIEQPERSEYPTDGFALVGGYLYAGAVCLDPADGSVVWKRAFEIGPTGWTLGAATGGTLYLFGEKVVALRGTTDGGAGGTATEPAPTTGEETTAGATETTASSGTTEAGTETGTGTTTTGTPECETPSG